VSRVALGMVHGRFQPFHLGHLAYLRGAAARSERLLVGITNPDRARTHPEEADDHRHRPEDNPFTYTERLEMLLAVLADEGMTACVIPFPVSQPELWPDYVPAGTVHFLRVFDDWGRTKVERLRGAGYEVVVLDEGEAKAISGVQVRGLLRSGGPWPDLVPPAVARVISSLPSPDAADRRPAA